MNRTALWAFALAFSVFQFSNSSVLQGMKAQENVAIRRNQVGTYPTGEKIIVVEGTNPAGKVKVKTPKGKEYVLYSTVF